MKSNCKGDVLLQDAVTVSRDVWAYLISNGARYVGESDHSVYARISLLPRSTVIQVGFDLRHHILAAVRFRQNDNQQAADSWVNFSAKFLQNQHLSLASIWECEIVPTVPLPLEQVIIRIPSSVPEQLIIDHFVAECVRTGVVIRHSAQYDYGNAHQVQIVSSLPISQGLLSESTKIIAVKVDTAAASYPTTTNSAPNLDALKQALLTNSFVQDSSPQVVLTQQACLLKPQVLTHMLNLEDILSVETLQMPETSMFVCAEVLTRYSVFSGDLVEVQNKQTNQTHILRVFALKSGSGYSQAEAWIGPASFFNLGFNGQPSEQLVLVRRVELVDIPVAREAVISRMAGPLTSNSQMLDDCIDKLVALIKSQLVIVRENDTIVVYLDESSLGFQKTLRIVDDKDMGACLDLVTTGSNTACFFKFVKLSSNSSINGVMRIDVGETKVVQSGVVNSFLPKNIFRFGCPADYPSSVEDIGRNIQKVVSSCLHPISQRLGLFASILLSGASGIGKRTLARSVADALGVNVLEANLCDILGETDTVGISKIQVLFEKAESMAPSLVLLRNVDAIGSSPNDSDEGALLVEVQNQIKGMQKPRAESVQFVGIIGTASEEAKVSKALLSLFSHQFTMESPSEKTRHEILKYITRNNFLASDVDLKAVAIQTAGLVAKDLVSLVSNTVSIATNQLFETCGDASDEDIIYSGVTLSWAHFEKAISQSKSSHADAIGAPKIPTVTWDDVGGMAHVRENIADTIQLPLERPELFADGMKKRSGILLYGPPGTGKTLVAKAVATNFSLNFLSVKGPELLNMYIGESEANVRRIFQKARDARPCVIFFDELDSVAPKRGEKGDAGGVMDRIVSQLLAELDGVSGGSGGDVFVIGATNRPDLLDPALLRPGRFDKLLYLGISQDHERQHNILQALTRKFTLSRDLDLERVAEACPMRLTGADLYALSSDAMLKAIIRTIKTIDGKIAKLNTERLASSVPTVITPPYYLENMATEEETVVVVKEEDFMLALSDLTPSVSEEDLAHYERVQAKFSKK